MFDIPKNRFTDYLSGRNRVDLPAAPIIVGDHAAYISKIPLTKVLLSGNELAAALIKTHDIYKQDTVFVFSDVTVEAEAMGLKLDFPVNEMPKIKSCPDPEKIKSGDPLKDGRMPEILEAGRICVRELGDKAQVFIVIKDPFSLSVLLRGPEEFLKN
ncbi:MAG: hypothetical protein GY863_06175, partial [bacterium]|nr:hypothetical protein [bacterium]